MRHRIYGKHLGRDKDERDNLFRGLVQALFTCGSIQTSETKAKAIKPLIDKIITSAKEQRTKRQLQSYLADKNLQERLTSEIIPKLGTRTSGYTKTIRIKTRSGDQTTMVRMSLIGAEELKPIESRVKSQESNKEEVKDQKSKIKDITKSSKTKTRKEKTSA